MKTSKVILASLAVSLAASLWAMDLSFLRPRLYSLDVALVVFLEHLIGFAILSAVFFPRFRKIAELRKNDWLAFAWVALFGGAIGTMAITKSLFLVNFNHLSVIVILQKLQPVFAILLARILLREKPAARFYMWAFAAVLGSYLVTFGFDSPVLEGNMLFYAAILSLFAAFSFGSSTVLGKRALRRTDYRLGTLIRFGLTSLLLAIYLGGRAVFSHKSGFAAVLDNVTATHIATLTVIALSTGGVAILIYYWGLRRITASRATILELAFPLTAVLLDYFVHGSVLDFGRWAGALLILFSIIMISRDQNLVEIRENRAA